MPAEERRRDPRVKLNELAYINLDSGNGGIVLDLSRGGFGLQLAVPLGDQNTIRFRLSVAPIYEVEATGEVAWKDETKKRVGLRVTQLPVEIRKQVQTWLGSQPQTSSERSAAPAPAATSAEASATNEMELGFADRRDLEFRADRRISDERSDPLSAEKIEAVPSPDQSFYTSPKPIFEAAGLTPGPAEPEAERSRSAYRSLSMFPSSQTIEESADPVSSRHLLTYAAFFLALVLGVCLGVVSYVHKREAGELLIRLREKVSGESRPHAIEPASPPAVRVDAGSLPNGDMTPDQTETHDSPLGAISKAPPTEAQEPGRRDSATANSMSVNSYGEDGGQSDLALARKYLRERSSPGYATEAEQLLWSAIEKGSTAAEVELADLYLSGDGLPKNCEQARVLFIAASNSNNAVAAERLANFRRYGCE
jgi:TPR repeat protein